MSIWKTIFSVLHNYTRSSSHRSSAPSSDMIPPKSCLLIGSSPPQVTLFLLNNDSRLQIKDHARNFNR